MTNSYHNSILEFMVKLLLLDNVVEIWKINISIGELSLFYSAVVSFILNYVLSIIGTELRL